MLALPRMTQKTVEEKKTFLGMRSQRLKRGKEVFDEQEGGNSCHGCSKMSG